MSQSLQDLIAGTRELRSLPATTLRLMNLLDDATVGADEVLAVIEKDLSLTANLLKLCNSAYFGLRRQVGSARQALVLMGNRTVINLAFATSMGDVLRGPLSGYHLGRNDLWHHALATAVGASHLASVAGDASERERAFTAGLMHDIGKLLLNRALKQKIVQLPPAATGAELRSAEVDILGFDHARAGAALAEAWNFPGALVAVIARHHEAEPTGERPPTPPGPDERIGRAVAMANLVATACGIGAGSRPLAEPELLAAAGRVGYAAEVITNLGARLPADLDGMLAMIGESR